MKLLVIGASGQVGGALMRLAPKEWEVAGTYSGKPKAGLIHLDVSDRDEVFEVFEKTRPDAAMLTAAFTNVDLCETYISTDYVFDGENGPYREDEIPNPLGYYAWTKLEGERITALTQEHLIIRTTGVYSADPDSLNFVMQVIKRLGAGETMRVPNDQYGSPTLADSLAEGIMSLLRLGKTGIYNIAGSDFMDRYSFALLIADMFDLDKRLITPIDTPSLGQKAKL